MNWIDAVLVAALLREKSAEGRHLLEAFPAECRMVLVSNPPRRPTMTHPYRTPALTHGTRYGRHCQAEWLNDKQLRVLSWWVLPFFGECLHRLRLLSPSSPQRALHDHRGGISLAHVDMPVPTRPEPGKIARRSERLSRRLASLAHELRQVTARDEPLPDGPAPGEEPME